MAGNLKEIKFTKYVCKYANKKFNYVLQTCKKI